MHNHIGIPEEEEEEEEDREEGGENGNENEIRNPTGAILNPARCSESMVVPIPSLEQNIKVG